MNLIAVFVGGGLGSLVRFYLSRYNQLESPYLFAVGTLFANTLSCLILGYFIATNTKMQLDDNFRLLLVTGFCGGFSTFSTFSWEIVNAFQKGETGPAISYMILSIFFGVLGILLGLKMGQ